MSEIQLIARYVISSGYEDEVKRLLAELAEVSRAEPGNLGFEAFSSLDDARNVVLLERYADADALATHRETPHFHALVLDRIVPLLESRVLETFNAEATAGSGRPSATGPTCDARDLGGTGVQDEEKRS